MPTRVSKSEYSISGSGDGTLWFDYSVATDPISFTITGTWSGTIELQVSNEQPATPSTSTRSRYSTVSSYTANQGPLEIPLNIGCYFRFVFTAYTSGTAYIGIGPTTVQRDEQRAFVAPQSTRNSLSSEF